jgi:hypothetical protein
MPDQAPNIDPNLGPGRLVYDKAKRTIVSQSPNADKHVKLNQLAASIKDSEVSCRNAYSEWCRAAEHLRNLEREHREIWLSLFDDIAAGR